MRRFSPARAGNTSVARLSRLRPTVQPRSRGEHGAYAHTETEIDRFSPARAGNTLSLAALSMYSDGSAPLARGTLIEGERAEEASRFSPARAGNTLPVKS